MLESANNDAAGQEVPSNAAATSNGDNDKTPRRSPSPVTVTQKETSSAAPQGTQSGISNLGQTEVPPGFVGGQSLYQSAQNPFLPNANALFHQAAITHNLIPDHLRATHNQLLAASMLHGTPGHSPALIHPGFGGVGIIVPPPPPPEPQQPILTVQDRPMVPPVYNGVNPNYPGVRLVNTSPPVFCVDNFLSPVECDFMIQAASDSWSPAPVVGKGSGEISPSRTSSTCYLAREDVPDLMRKVALLTGKPVQHCELPQVGRYLPSQQYLQHFDAFDLATEDGQRFAANGGQRTVTVLIYLNDTQQGGQTKFPVLNIEVQPKKGMALVFFPATIDGLLDKMALHAALPAVDPKFVSQIWIRQGEYKGQPSKRLTQTLGVPFGLEGQLHGLVQNNSGHVSSGVADMTH